ncbi:glucans biosynthesis glucosyltransferase MdoH [Hyphomicrobium denitrificans]|nr:glucans biosynthesis glucosyltransferase MdoH [Hyphomicrobium denitrificans]
MTFDCDRETISGVIFQPVATEPCLTTPAGFEAIATLARRRMIVLVFNLATWSLLMLWAGSILGSGGWTWLDGAILICLGFAAPWPVLGFWNAAIGLWQLSGKRGPAVLLTPDGEKPAPITVKTAVLMTLRNEDPVRALRRLKIVKESLDQTGEGQQFSYFVLSDTDRADVASREEDAIADWQAHDADRERIIYRRRDHNLGFKAGNVRDFATGSGREFELMLPLDADSLMTGTAILELVRIMQRHPDLGILQGLVVGTPTASAFARIFQFGMRLGMRTYTMGQAWWAGDCGSYWGHNALVRIAPFVAHCELPVLAGGPPLGGRILSHDQVEAALMRAAGFEVRVLPVEIGSFEDNPPNAVAFADRDARWCQGNLQYLKLIGLRGLYPVSRYQLIWAVLMFVGVPAWIVLFALAPFAAAEAERMIPDFPFRSAVALSLALLLMHLAPKLSAALNVMLTPGEIRRFGGGARFTLGAGIEILFSLFLAATTSLRTALFMMGLLLGRSAGWEAQARDTDGLTWSAAASRFWPHALFGVGVGCAFATVAPHLLLWSLPVTLGFVAAIPFAVLTASPAVGDFLRRHRIAGVPEDFSPPPEIRTLQLAGGF